MLLVYARPVLSLYQIRYTGAASQSTAAVRNSNISASTSTSAASSPRCQGESRHPKVKVGDTKNVVLRCRWNSTSKKWISLGSGGSATSNSTKFSCTFKCIGTEWPVGQWKCMQCDSYESSKTTSGNTHLGYHITGAHGQAVNTSDGL